MFYGVCVCVQAAGKTSDQSAACGDSRETGPKGAPNRQQPQFD